MTEERAFDGLFETGSLALIGASDREGSAGTPYWQALLKGGFKGKLYAVNPKYRFLGDEPCFKSVLDIEDDIGAALIAAPLTKTEALLGEIGKKKIPWAVLLLNEKNPAQKKAWQMRLYSLASSLGVSLLGPGAAGFMSVSQGLNATPWKTLPAKGGLSFAAQAPEALSHFLSLAREARLGLSRAIATGDEVCAGVCGALDFFARDPETKIAALSLEGTRTPRELFSSIRALAAIKPVLVTRPGDEGALSGRFDAPAGSLRAFKAAIRTAGAFYFDTPEEMAAAVPAFEGLPAAHAPRLAMMTTGQALAARMKSGAAEAGLEAPEPDLDARIYLSRTLNETSGSSPVDIGAFPSARTVKLTLEALSRDRNTSAIFAAVSPGSLTLSKNTLEAVSYWAKDAKKPLFMLWQDKKEAARAIEALGERVHFFPDMPGAFRAFAALSSPFEPPFPDPFSDAAPEMNLSAVRTLLGAERSAGRSVLSEACAKRLLASCGIPCALGFLARSPNEALGAAKTLGLPAVIKDLSKKKGRRLTAGPVCSESELLERASRALAEGAPELYIRRYYVFAGARSFKLLLERDPCWGPVLSLFGPDGSRAVSLPCPARRHWIEEMVSHAQSGRVLTEPLAPGAKEALAGVLFRLSALALEVPAVEKIEISPAFADAEGFLALTCHAEINSAPLERDAFASHALICPAPEIAPYEALAGKERLLLRALRPEDFRSLERFVSRLSEKTLHARFGSFFRGGALDALKACDTDYNRETSVCAFEEAKPDEIRAEARLKLIRGRAAAEFGIVVEDAWQKKGLGSALLDALLDLARRQGASLVIGYVAKDNEAMSAFMRRRGFTAEAGPEDRMITYTKRL